MQVNRCVYKINWMGGTCYFHPIKDLNPNKRTITVQSNDLVEFTQHKELPIVRVGKE